MPMRAPCRSRVGRRMKSRVLLLLEKRREIPQHAGKQRERLVGDLLGEHARGAGHGDVRRDDAGHEAVVEPRGRGLDPPQPAAADRFVPRHGHFGVAAENVGLRQVRRRFAPGRRRRSRPRATPPGCGRCAAARRGNKGRFACLLAVEAGVAGSAMAASNGLRRQAYRLSRASRRFARALETRGLCRKITGRAAAWERGALTRSVDSDGIRDDHRHAGRRRAMRGRAGRRRGDRAAAAGRRAGTSTARGRRSSRTTRARASCAWRSRPSHSCDGAVGPLAERYQARTCRTSTTGSGCWPCRGVGGRRPAKTPAERQVGGRVRRASQGGDRQEGDAAGRVPAALARATQWADADRRRIGSEMVADVQRAAGHRPTSSKRRPTRRSRIAGSSWPITSPARTSAIAEWQHELWRLERLGRRRRRPSTCRSRRRGSPRSRPRPSRGERRLDRPGARARSGRCSPTCAATLDARAGGEPDVRRRRSTTRWPTPTKRKLHRMNVAVTCLVIGVGVCLMLGLFTRLAAVGGIAFLADGHRRAAAVGRRAPDTDLLLPTRRDRRPGGPVRRGRGTVGGPRLFPPRTVSARCCGRTEHRQVMNLTPEQRDIGKQNFYEAVGHDAAATFLDGHGRRRGRRAAPAWAPCTSATARRSRSRCASASSARATRGAC